MYIKFFVRRLFKQRILTCILFTILFSVILIIKRFWNHKDFHNYPYNLPPNYYIHFSHEKPECNPIKNFHQNKTTLDGIDYPFIKQPLFLNNSIDFECLNKGNVVNTILAWNTFISSKSFGYGLGRINTFVKNNCPVYKCELTDDKSKLNISSYVLVHLLENMAELPQTRAINQKWAYFVYESPAHHNFWKKFNGYFNTSVSYRQDSEFGGFYHLQSEMIWQMNKNFDENFNFHGTKTKLATAIISNCYDLSNRLEYIEELKKYIQVDIYGKCGETCPTKYSDGKKGDCKSVLASEYKFYLSFENSICHDYISEKFFRILKYNIIPVVLGGANYSHFIPKSGYIDTRNFKSPKELARYLMHLDKNPIEYNSYFKWKRYVSFDPKLPTYGLSSICDICIQSHLDRFFGVQYHVENDMDKKWSVEKNCLNYELSFVKQIKYFLRLKNK